MTAFRHLREAVEAEGAGALVTIAQVEGSAPREGDAFMVVRSSGAFRGTIGGGALEFEAIAHARAALARMAPAHRRRRSLGPDLGQCCGGRVSLRIECFDRAALPQIALWAQAERDPDLRLLRCETAQGAITRRVAEHPADLEPGEEEERYAPPTTPVLLFGAGHVGRALVLALAPLPFAVRWIDPRPDWFPERAPANAESVATVDPSAEIDAAPPGAFVVVMTHSHPLDLDIVARALQLGHFPYVGLIGSATKRARFESRLRDMGIDARRIAGLVCPIGAPRVRDKSPAVIAATVAAELLQWRDSI
jgi:xanthine dehydrogenase accessory factor